MEDYRIKVFLTVVNEGGFKRAADVLGISQSAVSQRIADLEKELGTRLVSRLRPGAEVESTAVLTEAGKLFIPYAEKIASTFEEASALFTRYGSEKPVRIATTAFAAANLLPSALQDLTTATGAVFTIDIFPETTDFEQLLKRTRVHGDIFSPYDNDPAIAVWTSFDPSKALQVHTAATKDLTSSPLYRFLRTFLGCQD